MASDDRQCDEMAERMPGDGAEDASDPVQKEGDKSSEISAGSQEPAGLDSGGDAMESKAETTATNDTPENPDTSQNTVEKSEKSDTQGEDMEADSQGANDLPKETVEFKIVFNKKKYDVIFPLDDKVVELKRHIEEITGVPVTMQKVMYKGLMQDSLTLREQKVTKGCKMMVVGSTVNDIMSITAPDPKQLKEEEKAAAAASRESLSKQKPHKTVLEKHGKPDDILPGIKNRKDPLPQAPLAGMYNKSGGKVRLTFKMEVDQLWIGTKERTDKIPMGSIKAVVSEPLEDHEEYHLMGIQLGPTEASRYWIYWVPAQYVDAIKDAILGKWQFF